MKPSTQLPISSFLQRSSLYLPRNCQELNLTNKTKPLTKYITTQKKKKEKTIKMGLKFTWSRSRRRSKIISEMGSLRKGRRWREQVPSNLHWRKNYKEKEKEKEKLKTLIVIIFLAVKQRHWYWSQCSWVCTAVWKQSSFLFSAPLRF